MKENDISELETLLSLKFQHKQNKMASIVSEETKLRLQLRNLDDQERDAEANNQYKLKAIGADVIWKVWLAKTRHDLNLQLAQVLARKERLLDAAKRDHGKMLASGKLHSRATLAKLQKRQKLSLDGSIEQHLLQNFPRN